MKYDRRRMAAAVILLTVLTALCTGCGGNAAAPETRTRELRAAEPQVLGLLLSRENAATAELKAAIVTEADARGYQVRCYDAGNDPETQLRQVHQALAEGIGTLLVDLTGGEASDKIAGIVGDAGVVLIGRAPETAILDERLVLVGADEAGSGVLQGQALADYFWETDQGTEIRCLLFQGAGTDARSDTAVQMLLYDGFFPIAAADDQVCGSSRTAACRDMAALLAEDVDFDCVICDSDEMALGVIDALEAAGRDPAASPIVSVDHTAQGTAAVADGSLYLTVDRNTGLQARAAVAAAVNLDQGRPFDDGLRELLGQDCLADPNQPYTVRVAAESD